MKEVTLTEIQNNFPGYLKLAENEELVIMQDGKPVGMLINFNSSEDWFDYWLEGDPLSNSKFKMGKPIIGQGFQKIGHSNLNARQLKCYCITNKGRVD